MPSPPPALLAAKEAMPLTPFQGALAKPVPPRPLITALRVAASGEAPVPNWMMSLESFRSNWVPADIAGRDASELVLAFPRAPAILTAPPVTVRPAVRMELIRSVPVLDFVSVPAPVMAAKVGL